LQVLATPESLPVKDSVVPLKLSLCEAPQRLEEAVHEPPGTQTIRSDSGPRMHWLAGEHSRTCWVILYDPLILVTTAGAVPAVTEVEVLGDGTAVAARGEELDDVNVAVKTAATATMIRTAAAAPATITMAAPGPGSWGREFRIHRGTRLDRLAVRIRC
jgi:hypothetical protein